MKEKIKKMFQHICTWKFVMWLNIACVVYHIVGFLVTGDALYCAGIAWNAGYALVCYFLQKYEERHVEDITDLLHVLLCWRNCLVQLNRYKTRYGELPPDTPSVQPQQPSEESGQPKAETQQADAPSVADIPEESIAEPTPEPSAVSKKPRSVHRKPKRPAINPGTSHRTSSAAPKKPRTKKNKEEQS